MTYYNNTNEYSPESFFMLLKLGIWTDGYVRNEGRIKLYKVVVEKVETNVKNQRARNEEKQNPDYDDFLIKNLNKIYTPQLRVGTDLCLTDRYLQGKEHCWDRKNLSIVVFKLSTLTSEPDKFIYVKSYGSENPPFQNLFGKYSVNIKYPDYETEVFIPKEIIADVIDSQSTIDKEPVIEKAKFGLFRWIKKILKGFK